MLAANKVSLEADVCRQSFYDFFLRFWPEIVGEKLSQNWHLKLLCDELQTVAERVFKRQKKEYDLVVNISPGSTKSTICSEMFPAWCWTRDPIFRMICGSYTDELSMFLASQTYRIVSGDKYLRLFPEVKMSREAMGLMETSRGGQRIATSTGGTITGFHGHIIMIDDPINPKRAVSDVSLKTANEWFDHTLMSRMVDKSITPLILIMQRLHQNDPTGHILEKKELIPIRHIRLPARLNDSVRPRSLRKHYVNGLFDPQRLPDEILVRTLADMGEYAFAGQYGQHPIPMGGGMFRVDQIEICRTAPTMFRLIRYWDKAGSAGKGAWTVGVKMGLDKDRVIWILDVVRGQWEAALRERIIKQTVTGDDKKKIIVGIEQEPGSGGKESAQSTVKNLFGFRIMVDRPTGDKALRADPFATQVNGGNVKMLAGPWNSVYLAELQFFPFSKWKDQVDASSGAFSLLTKVKRVGAL